MSGMATLFLLRVLGPLTILRWPLAGALFAFSVDAVDVIIVDAIGSNAVWDERYAEIDKVLDTYYLALEAFVAWHWSNAWARWPAIGLFADRLVGAVAYEVTGARWLLFAFPNLFENWWLYCVVVARVWPTLAPRSPRSTAVILAVLLIPKFVQEYYLHIVQVHPWMWVRARIFGY